MVPSARKLPIRSLVYKYVQGLELCLVIEDFDLNGSNSCSITVKGELGVAIFLVNFFKRGPFLDISGCAPLPSCTFRYRY